MAGVGVGVVAARVGYGATLVKVGDGTVKVGVGVVGVGAGQGSLQLLVLVPLIMRLCPGEPEPLPDSLL